MSAVTLLQVLNADPAPLHSAAAAWRQLAEQIDDAAEQLIRGTRDLQDAWPVGTASQAAHDRTAALRAEVSNAHGPARRMFQALDRHAYAVGELRAQAEQIVSSARSAGFTVDVAAGTVTAPAAAYQGGSPEHTARAVSAVVTDLEGILGRARSLDESTAAAIRANLPQPTSGFGQLPSRPLSRQDLLDAQRFRTPKDIKLWWDGLTPAQQEQAITDHPDVVGWMNGVPADDRDAANRLALQRHQTDLAAREAAIVARMDEIRAGIHPAPGARAGISPELAGLTRELETVQAQRAALDRVADKLAELGDTGLLMGIDPAGDGKAIIAVGNPDTARHTAVWVPGLGTELGKSGDVTRVVNLQQAADTLTPEPNDVATVMWLGYNAPELGPSVIGAGRSKEGGAALDDFVNGLRATHDPGPSHLTVEGHSYGSTVVAEAALLGDGLDVDDILTAGSPGMHTDRAADLQIDPRHVWAGQADGDHVAGFGGSIWGAHGNEPSDEDFGGNRYVVDTEGHSAYWTTGSESLHNQALVVVGQYEAVTLEHGKAPQS